MNFDGAVDAVLAQFDTDQAIAVRIVNQRRARMLAEAEWNLAEKSLGNTLAGISAYDLPDEVGDVRFLTINTIRYDSIGVEKMRDLLAGDRFLRGTNRGVFAQRFKADGTEQFDVFPVPTTAGLPITAWESLVPADSTYGGAVSLFVPTQFEEYLLMGCYAAAYKQVDNRDDMAASHEQEFQQGIELLKRHKNKRVGSGQGRLQVAGYDY